MNLHSPSKSNTKWIVHQFLALFWYVCILRLTIFIHVYFAKNVVYFPFNSWLSFQRLCRLLRGWLCLQDNAVARSCLRQLIRWYLFSFINGWCAAISSLGVNRHHTCSQVVVDIARQYRCHFGHMQIESLCLSSENIGPLSQLCTHSVNCQLG